MAINKEYNDIQLDVKFTQASSRANIVSEENISVSFGKLAKWYEALVPTGGSSGKILAWNSSGTAKWSDPLHPTITKSADTTSTASPAHGETFTVVDSVTREANGHVTKINTKTVTLPSDQNTDTLMTQTNTTTSADYRVLLSGNANDTTETTTGRKSTNLKFNPSSGGLYSFGFLWTDITGQTLDINTLTLSNGTLHSRRFIEKTDGGAANITNIPVTGKPFLLEVDLIRWGSTTDYITRQRFTNAANGTYSYVRYCTNGTWGSWTTRKYTDTDTKVTSSANHYTPATASGQDKSDSATGGAEAWGIDVVKGVTLNTDGKGHVTGISVTSGKIPPNPVPSNNVTGSGTSGYLVKWNGTNTITNGPQLGSSTTTFLRNDGTWTTPPGTYSHPTYTERPKDIYKFHVNKLGHVDDATALDKTDVSTLINKLDTGSSTPVDADYYISQYVGGGATTTSYHRRPMSALWSYVKSKADSVYLPIGHTYPLSIAADSGTNQLTLSASTKYKLTAGGSTFVFTTPPDTKNTAGSTDTSSKIFLIGATSQATNPQTYSDNEVYTTSGVLTTKKVQVGGGSCTMEYNSTTQTLDFVFV